MVGSELRGSAPEGEQTPSAPVVARSRLWVEVVALVWLLWIYDAVNNLAPLRIHLALEHARDILSLERSLHIDIEKSLDAWMARHHELGLITSYYYDNAHFVVTLGVLAWMWWKRPDVYRPLRSALVLVNVIAFAVFWRYPVAPPRMLSGFTDIVAASGAVGNYHTGALASQANEYAAMPSLHIAWAVWSAAAIWAMSSRTWVRVLAAGYPLLTAAAVLATGNHFVLDLVGGLLAIGLAFALVRLAHVLAARHASVARA